MRRRWLDALGHPRRLSGDPLSTGSDIPEPRSNQTQGRDQVLEGRLQQLESEDG
jgi:hypothetical protein